MATLLFSDIFFTISILCEKRNEDTVFLKLVQHSGLMDLNWIKVVAICFLISPGSDNLKAFFCSDTTYLNLGCPEILQKTFGLH